MICDWCRKEVGHFDWCSVGAKRSAILEEAAVACEHLENKYESKFGHSVFRFAQTDCVKLIRAIKRLSFGTISAHYDIHGGS